MQPKEIQEIKDFLLTARRKDAKCAPTAGEMRRREKGCARHASLRRGVLAADVRRPPSGLGLLSRASGSRRRASSRLRLSRPCPRSRQGEEDEARDQVQGPVQQVFVYAVRHRLGQGGQAEAVAAAGCVLAVLPALVAQRAHSPFRPDCERPVSSTFARGRGWGAVWRRRLRCCPLWAAAHGWSTAQA